MKLTIECDRDIKGLNIQFGDEGETIITQVGTESKSTIENSEINEEKIDFGSYDTEVELNNEVVEKPEIDISNDRPPKVSADLQNETY